MGTFIGTCESANSKMNALLTTITPVWNRDSALKVLLRCLSAASIPEVTHLIYYLGSTCDLSRTIPEWTKEYYGNARVLLVARPEAPGASIAHYHNLGAKQASSEWIMKLDVDCIVNPRYFRELIPILRQARLHEWFNGGMIMISRQFSETELCLERMPLTETAYTRIVLNARTYSAGSYAQPEATNFICKRLEYLQLGGADGRFRQYGWEDYQQIYMLERHFRNRCPLPGVVDMNNVTQRCRDEISRPKAAELYRRNRWLCLFHRWHPNSPSVDYKSTETFQANRQVLLDYINKARINANPGL